MSVSEISDLLLNFPLYKKLQLESDKIDLLGKLFMKEVIIDTYCPECESYSTFKSHPFTKDNLINKKGRSFFEVNRDHWLNQEKAQSLFNKFWNVLEPIDLDFTCQRNNSHALYFQFKIEQNQIFKIGQYPSTATLDQALIHKYRKILGNQNYKDFNTGVGLASHGVGIGSFVYLRRVFENLIEESHFKAMDDTDWDEESYKKQRMNERIKMLEDYLPAFLVEHRELYGILSKGVHELEEKVCLDMFPSVKAAIEIILDQKIHEQEKAEKMKSVSKFIKDTMTKLKA